MLESIRANARGWVAYLIVGFVVIPFILWGVGDYIGITKSPVTANVNGEEIAESIFNQRFERLKNQQPEIFQVVKDEKRLKSHLLDEMVNQILLDQSLAQNGIRISSDRIRATIMTLPQFQKGGKFSRDHFERLLRTNGFTLDSFFVELEKDLARNQLEIALKMSEFSTSVELDRLYGLLNEQRKVNYILFSPNQFAEILTVPNGDLEVFYKKNRTMFKSQPEIEVEYIELKKSSLRDQINLSNNELLHYFEENKKAFGVEETRLVSHILVSGSKADYPKKMQEVINKINKGEDFSALAKQYSEDVATAEKGGDLGWLSRSELPPELAEIVFSLAKSGQVSPKPVKTQYGWHLVKIEGIKPGKIPDFEAVKTEVKAGLLDEKVEALFAEKEEEFSKLVYEHPGTLLTAASSLGLTVSISPVIKKDDSADKTTEAVYAHEKFLEAAFSEEVVDQDQNSAVFQLADGHLVSLRKKGYKPERQLTFEEAKEDIHEILLEKEARAYAKKKAEQLLNDLTQNADLAKKSTSWKQLEKLTRRDNLVDEALKNAVFKILPSKASQPHLTILPSGDVAVFMVEKITPTSIKGETLENKKMYSSAVETQIKQSAFFAHLAELKRRAKIEINRPTVNGV